MLVITAALRGAVLLLWVLTVTNKIQNVSFIQDDSICAYSSGSFHRCGTLRAEVKRVLPLLWVLGAALIVALVRHFVSECVGVRMVEGFSYSDCLIVEAGCERCTDRKWKKGKSEVVVVGKLGGYAWLDCAQLKYGAGLRDGDDDEDFSTPRVVFAA